VKTLGLPPDTAPPPLPARSYSPLTTASDVTAPSTRTTEDDGEGDSSSATGDKRKAVSSSDEGAKKTKTDNKPLLTVLREEDFKPPRVPGPEEMEKMIVERQKRELLAEYGVGT
jgi:pre-mRNA-splicing factor ISY1